MKLRCGAVINRIPAIHLTQSQKKWWLNWIDALESGKYKQTAWRLRDKVGFDCLGVACDLIDPEGWTECDDGYKFQFMSTEEGKKIDSEFFLPRTVREQMGHLLPIGFYIGGMFPDEDGHMIPLRTFALHGLNDIGATFPELAEIIRKAISGGYVYKLKTISETA
jgi:hypothetical protein